MRRAAVAAALVLALTAPGAWAGDAPAFRYTKITYLTTLSVYIGAGSEEGIEAGQVLEVVRQNSPVSRLEVTEVSPHRSVCERLDGETDLVVGDSVRYLPRPRREPEPGLEEAEGDLRAPSAPAGASSRTPGRTVGDMGLRGRIGLRYLAVRDRSDLGSEFSQPALDLRLDGTRVGGSALDVSVDVRTRRTTTTSVDGESHSDRLTSTYRLAASAQAKGSPWRMTVGRQFSPSLAAVNLFDGLLGEFRSESWSAGAFSGTQPDPADLGYSSSVREHGGFATWRSADGAERRWSMTTGLVGSYEDGEVSREFSYLQASYGGPRLSAWFAEEVDLNRGWKSDMEDSSVSMTSTFLNLRYRATENLSFSAGYDSRRNVRLYRDRVTPETEYDDAYREGIRGGLEYRFAGHFRAGVDAWSSTGGSLGGADSYTLTLGASRFTRAALYAQTRSTRYTNDRAEGWLHSVSLGLSPGDRWHLALSGGVRDETSLVPPFLDDQVTWAGLDIDLSIGRGWYLGASFERSDGDNEAIDQVYSSLTYRF